MASGGGAEIAAGAVTAFFLFDVADAIQLERVRELVGPTRESRLATKPPAPPYVQYREPPLALDGAAVGAAEVEGFRARLKVFDYGVVSVALTRPLPSSWDELLDAGRAWQEDPRLPLAAEEVCRELVRRLAGAVSAPRENYVDEDYFVFVVTALAGAPTAEELLERRGAEVAQLLRAEREPLSRQEREEVLRLRLSYVENDLVVPTWSSAFVYDTELGAAAALEILEFANSQLLELRYYDELLQRQLEGIYAELHASRPRGGWIGFRAARSARRVQALFIDVTELTDRTENALKIAGDVYVARLFSLAASRLGLESWKANVEDKLETLDDIYRFAVEQAGILRGELLELAIVLILVLELVLFFLGIMN